jgi:hypothetical protein
MSSSPPARSLRLARRLTPIAGIVAVLSAAVALTGPVQDASAGPEAAPAKSLCSTPRAGRADRGRFVTGFEEGRLRGWHSVAGHPRVQSRVRAAGRFALRLAAGRRGVVTRRLRADRGVRTRFCYLPPRRGAHVFMVLEPAGLALGLDRRGRLVAAARGGKVRLRPLPIRRRRWSRMEVAFDPSSGRVTVRVNRRHSTAGRLAQRSVSRVVFGGPAPGAPRPKGGPGSKPPAAPAHIDSVEVVEPPPAGPETPAPARPFAPDSFWNTPIADAPLDTKSDAYRADLLRQLTSAQPWINTTQYSTPVYTVGRDQPRVRVTLDEVANIRPDLQRAWESVPIPADAKAAGGSDKHMVVWQPSTDTMWEFWLAEKRGDGWHARWGGKIDGVSRNPGHFTDPRDWGATATSLPLLGGLIRLEELAAGKIDHALALALPETRAEWFSWPAHRTDGHVRRGDSIPEGARFRIDPSLDLSKLRMKPFVRMIAEAAQKYGIVVRDKSGAVSFYAEDPAPTGSDPYSGPNGYFAGDWLNNTLRAEFPWSRLQVVKTEMACCWKRG